MQKQVLFYVSLWKKRENKRERQLFYSPTKKIFSRGWLFCVSIPPATQIQVRRQVMDQSDAFILLEGGYTLLDAMLCYARRIHLPR
jgi:hypothetical protein